MEQQSKSPDKVIRIIWGNTDDTPVQYANQMSVSFAGGTEFHLTFGHLSPPLPGLDMNEVPDTLKIRPIITIVTSPDVMRAFLRALNDNMGNFDKMLKESGK